jgi:hypothetical protein
VIAPDFESPCYTNQKPISELDSSDTAACESEDRLRPPRRAKQKPSAIPRAKTATTPRKDRTPIRHQLVLAIASNPEAEVPEIKAEETKAPEVDSRPADWSEKEGEKWRVGCPKADEGRQNAEGNATAVCTGSAE